MHFNDFKCVRLFSAANPNCVPSAAYRNYEELYKYILSNDSTGTGFEK